MYERNYLIRMNDMEEIFEISNSKCCTRLEGVSMFFVLLLYNMQS